MELKHYLNLFRHWAWALLLGLVLGSLGGALGSIYQTPIYLAETKAMITRSSQDKNSDYSYLNSQQLTTTYMQLLKTRPLIKSVSERLGYEVNADDLTVTQIRDTQVIQIQVENKNPELAMAIANTLVEVIIEQNDTLQAGRYASTEASMQAQIDQVQNQITRLNQDIDTLSQQSIQDQIDQVQAQITPLEQETTRLEQEISTLEIPPASPEKNALVIEKQNRVDQIQPILTLYRQVYSNLLVLGKSTQGSAVNDAQLTQLQTTLGLYQQIYLNLLNSLESVRLSKLQNTPSVSQIEPATLPENPIRPLPGLYTLLAGVMGLLLAAGVVFLVEYLDDTIKTSEDIEHLLGLTVLGYVAEVADVDLKKGHLNVAAQPRSPVAEAFRSLRANLEFSGISRPLHTIMLTSAVPGEGKSTVAANLAAIIAQSGKRITLVDADLRRPSIHRFFELTNRTGLTDIFRGRMTVSEVVHTLDDDPNISVITTGSLPPNPTELLGSTKMDEILTELKETQDIVIVDCTPTIVADAQFLAAKVDGVLLIVRPGQTHQDEIRASIQQLRHAGANVLGVVFNRIPQNRSSYYGGYKQYSPYHYRTYQYNSDPIAATESVEINKK